MRCRSCSILYLAVMLFYILRPLLPYIEYTINKDYIEKNLCVEKENPDNTCHGKCYLQKQLNEQDKPLDADLNNKNKIITDKKTDDHFKEYLIIPKLYTSETNLSDKYTIHCTIGFHPDIFIPPKSLLFIL
jgi:hypothetical protein